MLTFQHLLQAAQVSLDRTKLVRHQDYRWGGQETPYHIWRRNLAEFEEYQSYQILSRRFEPGLHVASFVGTPAAETLFVGLYCCRDCERTTYGDGVEAFRHDLERVPVLGEEIRWGSGAEAQRRTLKQALRTRAGITASCLVSW